MERKAQAETGIPEEKSQTAQSENLVLREKKNKETSPVEKLYKGSGSLLGTVYTGDDDDDDADEE